ncbi:hypothetical protein EMIT0P12_21022 [Pseudomonas sp. IT-P12]
MWPLRRVGHLRLADAGKHWDEPWCIPRFIIFVGVSHLPFQDGMGEHYRRPSDNRLIKTGNTAIAVSYGMPGFQGPFSQHVSTGLCPETALAQGSWRSA